MAVPPAPIEGWSFPGDPPATDDPLSRASSPGRAERWSPPLPSAIPPPPRRRIPLRVRRLVRRAFLLGVTVPLVVRAGSEIGARFGAPAGSAPVLRERTIVVRDDPNGRFWGLPPNDRVRVPELAPRR